MRLLLLLCAGALAAQPVFEKTDVFEAGMGGYAHYRVPAIVVSPKGSLLAFAEARKSTSGDWGAQDIVMRRSVDGARTWDDPRIIARVPGVIAPNPVALAQKLDVAGEDTYNNIVPIADWKQQILHFLFCVEYARCYAMRSEDDARTFTDPIDITPVFEQFRAEYNWKVIATGPGHGIQLTSGRLLVPVWLSDGTAGHAHRPSIVSVVYSDDHGKTWKRGAVAARDPNPKNPSETLAIELADGRVMLNIRSESPRHRRITTTSKDGPGPWSKLEFDDELLEPICMASLIRYSKKPDRNRILFANPHSSEPRDAAKPEGNHRRQNVSVKLSYDEGKHWPVSKAVEPGISGYSDLAVGADGMVYLIYERGTPSGRDTHVSLVTVARFNLAWLTEGKDFGK